MILSVNDVVFENMTNDEAVKVLREAVQKSGFVIFTSQFQIAFFSNRPIVLTVAKNLNPTAGWGTAPGASSAGGYFTMPRQDEPVRPIDPGAWVRHTNAMRALPSILEGSEGQLTPTPGQQPLHHHHARPASGSGMSGSGNSNLTATNSGPESQAALLRNNNDEPPLTINDSIGRIVAHMTLPNSGLYRCDRTWLKITIPNAFLGSDLIDWLLTHVNGITERKQARKLAEQMLREGYIRHTVNKITFADQCYYVIDERFGEE